MLKEEIKIKLHNKVAVVTGAPSGVGRAIAELYAKEGAMVVVADPGMWSLRSWTESIWPEGQPWASLLGTQRSEAVEPIEIATVALFLASEDSKFVNGTVIAADGGWRRINP